MNDNELHSFLAQLGWKIPAFALIALVGVQYLIGLWIKARLESSIKHEYDKLIEEYKYDIKIREQAARVAEYLALCINLDASEPKGTYRSANKMAWELAMWLPADVYRQMAIALAKPDDKNNALEVVISIRKLLLREKAGDLVSDNVLVHGPGIGLRK